MIYMKDNKINIDLIVPSITKKYNLFIPANKSVGEVIKILNIAINEMVSDFPISNNLAILNVLENVIYDEKEEIIKTTIKNGSLLALI